MEYTVLIVDDEIAENLAVGLKKCDDADNIEFKTATDGAKCLESAETLKPDLILLDIGIPVIDGFKVLSELQERKIRTRIIMMSGYKTDLETAIQCVKAGACDYIVKGALEPKLMLERIRRALLVEDTLNVRVSHIPASAKNLIHEAELLKKKYEQLKNENEKLRSEQQKLVLEIIQKIVYVLLACGCIFLLKWVGIVQMTIALPIVFIFLIILLLIPSDKIQSISASINQVFSAGMTMKNDEKDDSKEKLEE